MSEPVKNENYDISKEGKVIISKEAFRNMITHVLRFGNEELENSVEVLGICLGKKVENTNNVRVVNAIPLFHGTKAEIGLSADEYKSIGIHKIEERYESQGISIVGWYHSHPGWGLYYSESDIKHHQFYQNGKKPLGFGIVFDYTLMNKEGELGLEVYRLDDYLDNFNTQYHVVEYELEKPNTLEYFKWVQKFSEDLQKKAPILIKEINEITEKVPENLQEIPSQGSHEAQVESKDQKLDSFISGVQQGTSQFSKIFMDVFKDQLTNWSEDVNHGALKGTEQIAKSISQMKEKTSLGLDKIERWFELTLAEILNESKKKFANYIDKHLIIQEELKNQFTQTKTEISTTLNSELQNKSKDLLSNIESKTELLSEKLQATETLYNKINNLVNISSEKTSKVSDQIKETYDKFPGKIHDTLEPLGQDLKKKVENISNELSEIKKTHEKMEKTINKLQTVINELNE
jgi:proteasome lid subunit RPN8/RPN11